MISTQSHASQYTLACNLMTDAMSISAARAIPKAQQAQQIFKKLNYWSEYAQARCLESQLRLRSESEQK